MSDACVCTASDWLIVLDLDLVCSCDLVQHRLKQV